MTKWLVVYFCVITTFIMVVLVYQADQKQSQECAAKIISINTNIDLGKVKDICK